MRSTEYPLLLTEYPLFQPCASAVRRAASDSRHIQLVNIRCLCFTANPHLFSSSFSVTQPLPSPHPRSPLGYLPALGCHRRATQYSVVNVRDKMETRGQVIFFISLVLLCATSMALDDADVIKTPNVVTVSPAMKENPQLCQLCEQFATEALFYLKENETQTEIIATLHQACSKFPSLKLECTRLIDYYAPLFFTKIASLSPEDFCVSVSFCAKATFIRLPRHEDTCTLCHEVVDDILTNLEDPDMELKIIEILLKGCNNADNFVQKCKRLIIQNAPIIMEHIKKFLEKRDFCHSIHVCGGKPVHAGAEVLRSLSSA